MKKRPARKREVLVEENPRQNLNSVGGSYCEAKTTGSAGGSKKL